VEFLAKNLCGWDFFALMVTTTSVQLDANSSPVRHRHTNAQVNGIPALHHSWATFDQVTLTKFQNFISTDFLNSISENLHFETPAYNYCVRKLENFSLHIFPK